MSVYRYESATPEQRALGSLWWCIHHDRKLEPLTEPIESRVACIRTQKAEHERETRLRALRPCLGPLPTSLAKAYAARAKAYAAWDKADAARTEAYAAWDKADAALAKADAAWTKAYAAWTKADAARTKAYAAWDKADAALQQALKDHAPEIDALFAIECADVPWGPDGLVSPEATP